MAPIVIVCFLLNIAPGSRGLKAQAHDESTPSLEPQQLYEQNMTRLNDPFWIDGDPWEKSNRSENFRSENVNFRPGYKGERPESTGSGHEEDHHASWQDWIQGKRISPWMVLRILPVLGSQVVFASPLPGMITAYKLKSNGEMPMLPFTAMTCASAVWSAYAAVVSDMSILLGNITGVIFGSIYITIYVRNATSALRLLPHYIGLSLCSLGVFCVSIFLETQLATNILGITADSLVIAMYAGPLSVAREAIQRKSTDGISPAFTAAGLVTCLLWTLFGFIIAKTVIVWLPNLLGAICCLMQVGLFAMYGLPKSMAPEPATAIAVPTDKIKQIEALEDDGRIDEAPCTAFLDDIDEGDEGDGGRSPTERVLLR